MNGRQLGGKKHDKDHKHLPAHQEPLHIVPLSSAPAQLECARVRVSAVE